MILINTGRSVLKSSPDSGEGAVIFAQNSGTQTNTGFLFNNANIRKAYSYVAGVTATAQTIRIFLNPSTSSTGTLIFEIREDNAGAPGTLIDSATLAASTMTPATFVEYDIAISAAQTLGSTYWLILNSASYGGVGSASVNTYRGDNESNDVVLRESNNGGSSYGSANQNFDLRFQILG